MYGAQSKFWERKNLLSCCVFSSARVLQSSQRVKRAGYYIKMATLSHQPSEYELVGGQKWEFGEKCGQAVYESIRKVPTGKTTEISVASQPSIWFFPLMARNGPVWPFFGP